ncbi:MAG TPA: methyltransferase domain-containing protein [Xanthobacteraceae bacterium]|jgi:SAM-dependent methyltransferase
MNRKQRRAAGARRAASAFGTAAPTTPATALAALFSAAVAHHQAGEFAAAEGRYRQILALFSNHAESHSRLGAVLMGQRRASEAIPHFERALVLKPDLFEAWGNLAQAYIWTGNGERAIEAACRALELRETAHGKALFAQCVGFARFTADNGRFRRLVLRALLDAWVRPRELTQVCISLIKLNRLVNESIAQADAAWPARLPAAELLAASRIAALADDELLCRLLECDPVTDIGLERLLTNVRYAMLIGNAEHPGDDRHLDFYCSIARQCFVNEYVYSTTEVEAEQAQRLRQSLEAELAAGRPCSVLWPVIVGAYFPLHTLSKAEALVDRYWPKPVEALIAQQVREPAEERETAATIPMLTGIDSKVSHAVRQQYEANPYPRWVKAGPPAQPAILFDHHSMKTADALVAGCGTGLSTIEFAQRASHARIVAIDLSLASLSYAKRMAHKLRLTNVEFAQADILKLGSIGRDFDFIDASGVLHHLADPWEGWRVLLSLLRPGGSMQVGLYSELARRSIVAARALVAERGYRPIPEDIRRCREDVTATDNPLLKSVVNAGDFFTMSECRDLLFHVQEHRTTLLEVKSFLAASGVQFAGFFLDEFTRNRFLKRFPEEAALTDLDQWHAFETEAPGTFVGMYQFAVKKPIARAEKNKSPH